MIPYQSCSAPGIRSSNTLPAGLRGVQTILRKQQPDGSFRFSGTRKPVFPKHHYELVETFRNARLLVKRYGLTAGHESVRKAADYIFSCQSEAGDFRGFIGNQYATY